MLREFDRKLIFEDGSEYPGYSFGDLGDKVCEIVFNTSMVGYQEILSDPSYTYQAVVMTYPLIGNYGMAQDDYESANPAIGALIVGEYNDFPSNFRSTQTLGSVMEQYHIPGIFGVDTRKLTRYIRDFGSRKVLLTDIACHRRNLLHGLRVYRARWRGHHLCPGACPQPLYRTPLPGPADGHGTPHDDRGEPFGGLSSGQRA